MAEPIIGTLQLDFDGTLAEGDVSTGILSHFLDPEWRKRVEAASRQLLLDPDSPALVDAMTAGFDALKGDRKDYLSYAHEYHPPRPGLPELIDAAERVGLECHIVSNGFEFYIRDYLQAAGVDGRVDVHTGSETPDGRLAYLGPDGQPSRDRFKLSWTQHFLIHHDLLVYVGDGSSDVAPAQLASTVFARDSLLTGMPGDFRGTIKPFETLHDVAQGLRQLLS